MKNQKSKAARRNISRFGNYGRMGRLFSIAMLITLSLAASPNVMAQIECLGICEQNLERCLREPNSLLGPPCIDQYEACVNACLGAANAVLG
jgi:hypothetical protein